MTRARFFAALAGLAGVAKAQVRIFHPRSWRTGSAVNNQCPVCEWMAEPLARVKTGWSSCKPTGDGQTATCEPNYMDPQSPQLTRCLRCNAAFLRDYAPEVKP